MSKPMKVFIRIFLAVLIVALASETIGILFWGTDENIGSSNYRIRTVVSSLTSSLIASLIIYFLKKGNFEME